MSIYWFQSAQEKYELQQQGDELDAKIRTAEKEIQAMENTLKVINAANDKYKKNLSAVDGESKGVLKFNLCYSMIQVDSYNSSPQKRKFEYEIVLFVGDEKS